MPKSSGGVPQVAPGYFTQAMIQQAAAERLEKQIAAQEELAHTQGLYKLGGTLLGSGIGLGATALGQHMKGEQALDQMGRGLAPAMSREQAMAGAAPVTAPEPAPAPVQPALDAAAKARVATDAQRQARRQPETVLGPSQWGLASERGKFPEMDKLRLGGPQQAVIPPTPTPTAPPPTPAALPQVPPSQVVETLGPATPVSPELPPQPDFDRDKPVTARGAGVIDSDGTFIPERAFRRMYPDPERRESQRLALSIQRNRDAKTAYQEALAVHLERQGKVAESKELRELSELTLNWRKMGINRREALTRSWDQVASIEKKLGFQRVGKYQWVQSDLQLKFSIDSDPSSDTYMFPMVVGFDERDVARFGKTVTPRAQKKTQQGFLYKINVKVISETAKGRERKTGLVNLYDANVRDAIRLGVGGAGSVFKSQREVSEAQRAMDLFDAGNQSGALGILKGSTMRIRMQEHMKNQLQQKLPGEFRAGQKQATAAGKDPVSLFGTAEGKAEEVIRRTLDKITAAQARVFGTGKKLSVEKKIKKRAKVSYLSAMNRAHRALKRSLTPEKYAEYWAQFPGGYEGYVDRQLRSFDLLKVK